MSSSDRHRTYGKAILRSLLSDFDSSSARSVGAIRESVALYRTHSLERPSKWLLAASKITVDNLKGKASKALER